MAADLEIHEIGRPDRTVILPQHRGGEGGKPSVQSSSRPGPIDPLGVLVMSTACTARTAAVGACSPSLLPISEIARPEDTAGARAERHVLRRIGDHGLVPEQRREPRGWAKPFLATPRLWPRAEIFLPGGENQQQPLPALGLEPSQTAT